MACADVGNGIFLGFTSYNPDSHAQPTIGTSNLWSDDALCPLEPGIRLQLVGRLSDQTAIEANCWGLQQWSVGCSVYGDHPFETVLAHSPWLQTSKLIGGFDNELGYTYQSQVANVELNQRLKLFAVDPYRGVFLAVGLSIFLSVRRFLADRIRHQLSGVRNAPLADEEQPARRPTRFAVDLGLGSRSIHHGSQGRAVRQRLLPTRDRFGHRHCCRCAVRRLAIRH